LRAVFHRDSFGFIIHSFTQKQFFMSTEDNVIIQTNKGLDYENGAFKEVESIKYQFLQNEDEPHAMGTPITLRAAQKMIRDYFEQKNLRANSSENICITFGKDTLHNLLLQKNSVGIRFYFCINDKKKMSLVALGVDDKGKELLPDGIETEQDVNRPHQITDPLIYEIGGGYCMDEYMAVYPQKSSINLQPLLTRTLKERVEPDA
jgi:hypothetical protein